MRLKLFFDGGCRPNPGEMETAVFVRGRAYLRHKIGYGNSMDAEWLALIEALRMARALGTANVVILGDAVAVVGQANGTVKCRGTNMQHLENFHALLGGATPPRIRYIKRNQNLAGIALARNLKTVGNDDVG